MKHFEEVLILLNGAKKDRFGVFVALMSYGRVVLNAYFSSDKLFYINTWVCLSITVAHSKAIIV